MRTRVRLLPLLAATLIGATAAAGPAWAEDTSPASTAASSPAASTPAPSTPSAPSTPTPTAAPTSGPSAAPTTAPPAPITTPAPVTSDPAPVVPAPPPVQAPPAEVPQAEAPAAAPTTSRPPVQVTPRTEQGETAVPQQPGTGTSDEAVAAAGIARSAADSARAGAQAAAESEAGQLLATGYAARAQAAAAADPSSSYDQVARSLDDARTARALLTAQGEAVSASAAEAQAALAAAGTARDQVLALPQSAAGVAEQTAFAGQVLAAAQVSVDRAAAAAAAVGAFTAPVDDAVATLSSLLDRLDPTGDSTPLPDVAAVYALGGVVLLGAGVTGITAVSRRRSTVRRRVAARRYAF